MKPSLRHFDVKSAFLNGDLDEDLYMEQPPGYVQKGKENCVIKVNHSIYGLKQSAHAWNKKANEIIVSNEFIRSKADSSLYTRKEKYGSTSYILLYVDDLLIANLGNAIYYLGIQMERKEDGTILLYQKNKIENILNTYGMENAKSVATPMETSYLSNVEEPNAMLPNNTKYRQVIGSLLYIATVSRPDIASAVGILCRRVSEPTERDWKAVKRVMRYLSGTRDMKLELSAVNDPILKCYVDADWAGDKKDRKSTSGYIFLLGKAPITWSSKKQTSVAISSTEAEYVAAAYACQELLWLRQLLSDMALPMKIATPLYEENHWND